MTPEATPLRSKILDRYHESTYSACNDLTPAGISRAAAVYKRELGSYLPDDRSQPLLEIGCGIGAFLTCAQELGFSDVRGIDIAPDQIDFCRQLGLDNVSVADGLGYLQDTEERFAAVVMSDVLEHMAKNEALATLESIREHLLPGGRVILRVPNLSNPLNIRTRYVDITHELGFSQESLAQVLRATGFRTLTIHGAFELHNGLIARWLFDRLLWGAFRLVHRHTLHLKAEIVRGKNLIAVAEFADD